MRGALLTFLAAMWLSRIIPADAGSTRRFQTRDNPIKDHPRGCGEHLCPSEFRCSSSGSSPRMRGARRLGFRACQGGRIIPADAGSTWRRIPHQRSRRDHPRGCGEHACIRTRTATCGGSSPRMRGAPVNAEAETVGEGIIPADAGSTSSRVKSMVWATGSSPRMRGAQSSTTPGFAGVGIIPADAGSTTR